MRKANMKSFDISWTGSVSAASTKVTQPWMTWFGMMADIGFSESQTIAVRKTTKKSLNPTLQPTIGMAITRMQCVGIGIGYLRPGILLAWLLENGGDQVR